MTTVDLVTFCYPGDIHRAYAGLAKLVASFKYAFNEIILIKHNCRGIEVGELSYPCRVVETEDYPWEKICSRFNIDPEDSAAEAATSTKVCFHKRVYYWKDWMHKELIGLLASSAEYVALINCDCLLIDDPPHDSWVDRGLRALQSDRSILLVGPNQRQAVEGDFKTQDFSSILMLSERQRLLDLDYNVPLEEGLDHRGFLGVFYYIFEGRLWRHARLHNEYRMVLAGPPWLKDQDW